MNYELSNQTLLPSVLISDSPNHARIVINHNGVMLFGKNKHYTFHNLLDARKPYIHWFSDEEWGACFVIQEILRTLKNAQQPFVCDFTFEEAKECAWAWKTSKHEWEEWCKKNPIKNAFHLAWELKGC